MALSNRPKKLKTSHDGYEAWYYEKRGGIEVIVMDWPRYIHIKIPWTKIRRSLKNKDNA